MNTPRVPPGSPARRGLLLIAVVSIMVAACGTAASPGPSTTGAPSPGGSASPVASPSAAPIEHATGRTDVVFRFEEGGGFVPVGFFATEAPIFTLYGDGTVIFKDGNAAPPPESDGIIRTPPYRTVTLTEEQIQAFLRSAISDGGLGVARDYYESPGADLPTATFTMTAGGMTKSVSVLALGMDRGDGPDTQVLQALAGLGERIRDFGREAEGERVWTPDRWRGVLTPDAFSRPGPWPWPDVSPVDFIQHSESEAPRFPVRTMSPAEIALLRLHDIEGGFSSLSLTGPDGATYLFALRPLFPDESY